MYDRNPKFGADQSFSEGARRVADLLWQTTHGNLSSFPPSYLENLRHDFADGRVSMLELMDRVDLGEDATYDDYCEVVESLLCVPPSEWPDPNSVLSVPGDRLLYDFEPDLDFSEFDFDGTEDFAEDSMSTKMELFLKKVIASVYLDGVSSVTDAEGNPPNEANNYLLSDDGKTFSGTFYDTPPGGEEKQFPFTITESGNGQWSIRY